MKRFIVVLVTLAIAACVTGCGGNAATSSTSSSAAASSTSASASASESSSSSSSLFTAKEWEKNAITEQVPEPHFSVPADTSTTTTGVYSISYKNVPEKEASAYIDEVKAAGFTYSPTEMSNDSLYHYAARNAEKVSDGTSVELSYRSEGDFNIIVSRVM